MTPQEHREKALALVPPGIHPDAYNIQLATYHAVMALVKTLVPK